MDRGSSIRSSFADKAAVKSAINTIAGHRNALDGELIDIAIWLLSEHSWQGEGLTKPEQFLALRCGISAASARRYVDAARRSDELPESIEAVRRGELSLDQLMPIVRRAPGWAEGQVARLATKLTVGQINAVINKYPFDRSAPDGAAPAPGSAPAPTGQSPDGDTGADASPPSDTPVPADRCWHGVGDDGRWRMHVETSPELGSLIGAAIAESRDRHFLDSGHQITDAEALADIAQRSIDATTDPGRRDRFRTNIHLDIDGRATDNVGAPLPDVIARLITCDGLWTPIFLEGANPVSVGRTRRIVPERTRKIVLLRDGGCTVPGCGATHHVEVHHIIHWVDGGPTDSWNLVTLCPHHHRMHHQGNLGIVGDADAGTLRFTNSHGIDLATLHARPEPPVGPPSAPTGEYQHPLGERLDMDYVTFVDPAMCVKLKDRPRPTQTGDDQAKR